jgi:putative ABC transport system permease protein
MRAVWREARQRPGQLSAIVTTLALVTAGSTTVFAVAASAAWHRLSVAEPDRLVALGESNAARGYANVSAAPANVLYWREHLRTVTDIAFYNDEVSELPLERSDGAIVVRVARVSGNFLPLVGARAAWGDTFTFDDTWAERAPAVVLSDGLWRRAFGADGQAIGRTIRLDGLSYDVRGVLPPDFDIGLGRVDAWVPMRWESSRRTTQWFRQARVVRPLARLAPGATLEQLRSELRIADAQLARLHPDTNDGWSARATPFAEFLAGDRRMAARYFLAAALVLQVLGCANVAAVLVARGLARRREHALREALGAGRSHALAAALAEAGVLAAIGACGGILLALAGLRGLEALQPETMKDLAIDWDGRVAAFVAVVAAFSAAAIGLWPALGVRRLRVSDELAAGSRTATMGTHHLRLMHGILAIEVALAAVLALGAGTVARGLQTLQEVPIGSNTANVLAFAINAPSGVYGDDGVREAMIASLVHRLAALPGVVEVAAARHEPLGGLGWTSDFTIDSWPVERFGLDVRHRQMTSAYFSTLQVPLLAGRLFEDRPRDGQAFEAVVNQAFVDRYFPAGDAVGRRVAFSRTRDAETTWHAIVGVVGDERMSIRQPPSPEIHGPLFSDMPGIPHVLVRASTPALDLAPAVRAAVAGVDPQIALDAVRSLDDAVDQALAPERLTAAVLGVLAAIGLLLAAVAMHGLTAQVVRSRADELRIRKVLGATDASVVRALLRPLLAVMIGGLALGAAAAATLGVLTRQYGLGASPTDVAVVAPALAWLLLAAVIGTMVPLRQAIRMAPEKSA